MAARQTLKLTNAAIDEAGNGEIIIRGVIAPDSFQLLLFGEYQREVLPRSTIEQMASAILSGKVPDIDVGVRGGSYEDRDGTFYVKDPCFVVDGKQRVTAAIHLMNGGHIPHLGATLHFGSTEESERERFRVLNQARTKVSPNVLLRNLRHQYPAVQAMYDMSLKQRSFVMTGKVCWVQSMQRGHLITALMFAKAAVWLHSHVKPGKSTRVDEIARTIDGIGDAIGPQAFRGNIVHFFEVIDMAWGVRTVAFREGSTWLKGNFLLALANLFSNHEAFWKGNRLAVNTDDIRKLRLFPVSDPSVMQLAAGSSQSLRVLNQILIDHLNSGRRTKRLVARAPSAYDMTDDDAEESDT